VKLYVVYAIYAYMKEIKIKKKKDVKNSRRIKTV